MGWSWRIFRAFAHCLSNLCTRTCVLVCVKLIMPFDKLMTTTSFVILCLCQVALQIRTYSLAWWSLNVSLEIHSYLWCSMLLFLQLMGLLINLTTIGFPVRTEFQILHWSDISSSKGLHHVIIDSWVINSFIFIKLGVRCRQLLLQLLLLLLSILILLLITTGSWKTIIAVQLVLLCFRILP